MSYYDTSYPPSLWEAEPAPIPAVGAVAGIPGTWTPAGSAAPSSVANLIAGVPNAVTATPATAWTVGQYVQTGTAGAAGQAHWNGTTWVTAPALLEAQTASRGKGKRSRMGTPLPDEPDQPEQPDEPDDEPTE